MKKETFLFWSLFIGILVFAFGVQFAYSQSGGFATTSPSSGVSHTSNEIVCNGCINSANIADGAVTTDEFSYDSIMDREINPATLLSVRKTNGVNGWHFTTGSMPNVGVWYPAIATDLISGVGTGVMGIGNWFQTDFEIVCDSNELTSQGNIIIANGLGLSNVFRNNHRIHRFHPQYTGQQIVYFSRMNSLGLILPPYQILMMRSSTSGDFIEFSRQYVPGTGWSGVGGIEPEITNFECVVKILSLCNNNAPCTNFAY